MNKHNNKANLEALYQSRKRRHLSPASVELKMQQNMAAHAASKKSWWNIDLHQYARISTITICLAALLVVLNIQVVNQSNIPVSLGNYAHYTSIQLHELYTEENTKTKRAHSETSPIRVKYETASANYLAQQRQVKAIEQTYARILQHDDGMSLLTCEQGLVEISAAVLSLLNENTPASSIDYSKGQLLKLQFDKNGHIMAMTANTTNTSC